MAIVYPLANGNWSTVANWYSGGVAYGQLPLATDDVYSDGKTVTIDQNVTVANLYTSQRTGGINGGSFTITSGSYTINANLNAGGGTCLNFTSTGNLNINGNLNIIGNNAALVNNGTGTITIIGNISNTLAYSNIVQNTNNNANLIVTGNITITGNSINTVCGIINNGTNSKVTFTGNIAINSADYTSGINNSSNNSAAVIVNGTVNGGYGVGAAQTALYNFATSGTVILNGIASALNGTGAKNANTGTLTINGNQTVVGNATTYCILNSSSGIVNVNGDILGALSSSPSTAYMLNNSGTGTVNISGNVTARSVSPSTTVGIVNNASTGTINVTGNVTGGSVANTIGISNASTGTINVTGNITGGSNATNTPAIYSTTAGTVDVTGSCNADAYPALFSTATTATNRLRGDVTAKNGIVAYYVFKLNISPTAAQQFTFQDTSNVNRVIATSNISPGAPAPANVRFGTVYGSSSEFTGTLRVPLPQYVSQGVLTDNTVGTAYLSATDVWNVLTSTMTTAGSIGERLKNASTVQTTGDQLASYIV